MAARRASLPSPGQRKPRALECGAIIHPAARAVLILQRGCPQNGSVRGESEADVKRYVKCIFARKRGILGLLAGKEPGWSDRHCWAVPRGTVISVTYVARRVD